MKILFGFILIIFISICPCFATKYGVYMPQNYSYNPDEGERILFIIDLSNSMNESLERDTKYNLMLKTMKEILPQINPKTEIEEAKLRDREEYIMYLLGHPVSSAYALNNA